MFVACDVWRSAGIFHSLLEEAIAERQVTHTKILEVVAVVKIKFTTDVVKLGNFQSNCRTWFSD